MSKTVRTLVAIAITAGPLAAGPIDDLITDGRTDGQEQAVTVEAKRPGDSDSPASSGQSAPSDVVYWRQPEGMCRLVDLDESGLPSTCADDTELRGPQLDCTEDEYELTALYGAERDPETGELGLPRVVEPSRCITPADLAQAAAREFARLPIQPSPVHVQPPDGWTLINVDTITYTDDQPQTFDAELLGVPVTLRAVPAEFTWDYDDDTPALITSDAGAAYPHHTVAHTYTRPGTAAITLTTTWHGEFQITGTPTWTPVPGEATTETTTDPITVHEARTRLVEDPLPGSR